MRILVIGSGGREHAIIKKLLESPKVSELYAAPGNGGIGMDAICVDIKVVDIQAMVTFAVDKAIDLVVVAPETPLAMGMVDAMIEKGIRAFGPNQSAARIEGSKVFSKDLMKRYGIPTAKYESFDNIDAARKYVQELHYPIWIKADGLALGKGAIQATDIESAHKILEYNMVEKAFGESGSNVIIEEHMVGPEVTVLAFCDGKTIRPMVSSMDFKRAQDNNEGPNTGGMGAIAPNPHYTEAIATRCMNEIFLPTIHAMESEGCPFKGCLYFGLILTASGPKVIEYNCRFGDPEAQVILPMLETDLLDIMVAVCDGTLANIDIQWKSGAAACVIMASGGYPYAYDTGLPISGLDKRGGIAGAAVYHSGTRWDSTFLTSGGRVLGISTTADTLKSALETVYRLVGDISFEGVHYRRDIGNW